MKLSFHKGPSGKKKEPVADTPIVDEASEENLRERRYLWTARAAAVVAVGSFCTNIILLMALSHLSPLVRTNPFFLSFQNREAQVVTIEPPVVSESFLKTITNNMIRQYLVAREAIPVDYSDLSDRWSPEGPVRWMSADPIFEEFRKKDAEPILKRVEEEHLTRQVRIASVRRRYQDPETGNEVWDATITITEMSDDSPQPKDSYYTVSLQIAYQPQMIPWKWRLKNPLGFKVKSYARQRQDAIF